VLIKARKSRATEIDILVSKNLKARRLELGISQSVLANLAGVSTQQIQKYEKNINRISSGRLFAFTKYLKVPITYFIEQNQIRKVKMNNKKTDILKLLQDLRDNCFHEYIDEHELLDKIEEIRELILILRVRDGYIV
jgi:hypothetical protein